MIGEKEHVTTVNEEGQCVWCDYYAVQRHVKPKDIRDDEKNKRAIKRAKFEKLSIMAREKNHNEKIN